MMKAAQPVNESLRLADLYQYNILDTPAEDEFEDLVKLASRICNAPVSLISLLDANRQWFKARIGMDDEETPRDISFCSHGILGDGFFIVPDAAKDERFADNPMVKGHPGIRFYAGVPLTSPAGNNLGMLCVKDTVPRDLSPEQQEALIMLGKQAVKQMELRLKNQELERMSEAQRRIISIIAHDVRSPLASIIGLFRLYLNNTIDTQRLNDFLHIANTQLNGTLSLLENLVAWGKIQSDQAPLIADAPILKDEVQKVFTELTVQANLKENRLINLVPASLKVNMDENIVRFIIRNLLTNANKFTQHGSITVDAFSDEKTVTIRVTDTGLGMPRTMSERLFISKEKFSRKGTQNETGSGLGLVLIREFIEKARGIISVESIEGQGSCFVIELPK